MKVYVANRIASLAGHSDVTDESGTPLYTVQGKVFSITRKKSIYDGNGNLLYVIRNKFLNFFIHKAYILDASGNTIARVHDKLFNFRKQYFVDGLADKIQTDGNFFSLSTQIYRNGTPIGIIRRKIKLFADKFELEASPEDLPFMIALVIAIDNISDNKQN